MIKDKYEMGFTLLEIIIVISITGLIGAAVFNTYFSSWETVNFNQNKMGIQQAHRLILSRIKPYIREARKVEINAAQDKLIIMFDEKNIEGSSFNLFEYGVIENEFYLKKGYYDGTTSNWENISTISKKENIAVSKPVFNYNQQNQMLVISLTLSVPGKYVDDYTFTDSVYLRNEEIVTGL